MGYYEILPLVNFNITESFQVTVNSLDYTRPEEQYGLYEISPLVNFNITESFQVRLILWTINGPKNNMEFYEISPFHQLQHHRELPGGG
jgi:hypothetical protein